jgi:plasmid segregation protein ParM
LTVLVSGIDAGRNGTKYKYLFGKGCFESNIKEWREIEFKDEVKDDDIIGEYHTKQRKFIGGSLASRESQFGDEANLIDKLHEDTVLLICIAIHKMIRNEQQVKIVTGMPIDEHALGKEKLKQMLLGSHDLTINGTRKRFVITEVNVALEGAYFMKKAEEYPLVRGLDIGSRTVNALTIKDQRKIGIQSTTINFGMNTGKSTSIPDMTNAIAGKVFKLGWNRNDVIFAYGGGVYQLQTELKKHFSNIEVCNDPLFCNAEAYYLLARKLYG